MTICTYYGDGGVAETWFECPGGRRLECRWAAEPLSDSRFLASPTPEQRAAEAVWREALAQGPKFFRFPKGRRFIQIAGFVVELRHETAKRIGVRRI